MSSFERSIFNTTSILMCFLFLMSLASLPYIVQSSVFMINYEKLIQSLINYKSINAQYLFNPNVFSFYLFSRKSSFNRLGISFYQNYEKMIQALISIQYLFRFLPSCLFLSFLLVSFFFSSLSLRNYEKLFLFVCSMECSVRSANFQLLK